MNEATKTNGGRKLKTYQQRVDELESEGLTNCDACDIAEGELLEGKLRAGSDPWAKGLLNVLRSSPEAIRIRQENKLKKKLATA